MRRRYYLLSFIVVMGLALLYCWHWTTAMPARKALPWFASDIYEELITFGILPDHSYVLKAEMSEAAFADYVQRLQLKPWRAEVDTLGLNWSTCSEQQWWTPSSSTSGTWYDAGSDWRLYAKYENGYAFVHSFEQ